MENRENIVADYFKLRVLLNKTNLKRDQKTELEFRIERRSSTDFYFAASLKNVRNAQMIELCRQEVEGVWVASGFSGLFHLEKFCAMFLRKKLSIKPNALEVRKVVGQLGIELRSLGIPR